MTIGMSLIMGCRIGGNENSKLINCLNSVCEKLSDKQQVELLIKFDDDDPNVPAILPQLDQFRSQLAIQHIITPRGVGYGDLHKAYLDLFLMAAPTSKVIWVISDDIELHYSGEGGWDDYMLSLTKKYEDGIFVLHPRELLGQMSMTIQQVIDSPDPYPAWSRNWILTQGGFGATFSTDGWTGMVEHHLAHNHKIDRRIHMPQLQYKRYECAADLPGSERFNGIRRTTHEKMLSEQGQAMVASIAANISRAVTPETIKNKLKIFG